MRETLPGADLFDPAPVNGTTCTSTPRQRNDEPFRLRMALRDLAFGEPTSMRERAPGPYRLAFIAVDSRLGRCDRIFGDRAHVADVCVAEKFRLLSLMGEHDVVS
jgi:hypothetical protein